MGQKPSWIHVHHTHDTHAVTAEKSQPSFYYNVTAPDKIE